MESKNKNNTLIIVVGIILAFVVVFFLTRSRHDWVQSFKEQSEEPYGTHIFQSLLESSVSAENHFMLRDTLSELPEKDALFVFVGHYAYLDSAETEALCQFIRNGNTVLISSKFYNKVLIDRLDELEVEDGYELEEEDYFDYEEELLEDSLNFSFDEADSTIHIVIEDFDDELEEEEFEEDYYYDDYIDDYMDDWWSLQEKRHTDTTITTSLVHPDNTQEIELEYVYDNEREPTKWFHYGDSLEIEWSQNMTIKGRINDSLINFIGYEFGDGELLIHSTPMLFTNFSLLEKSHFLHIEQIISEIEYDKVVWDEVSRTRKPMPYQDFERNYDPKKGPLNFILSEKSLRWAWYLLMITILIYVIFGARRKQRIIPVIKSLPNTSIQFAETLSQLYQRKKDHRRLAMLKWSLFLNHIRGHYGMNTQFKDDEERAMLIKKISLKSGIVEARIEQLFDMYKKITIIFEVDDDLFIKFHQQLEEFYSESK